ncbi:MAG: carbohydrate kinase [Planctomycetaceae bacterium]
MSRRATIIGLGELLWDCFSDARRPGGAPANFAFHAQQLGGRGLVASRVGHDADGQQLLDFLTSKGLETSLVPSDPEHPTGRVTVSLNDGQPTYVIHEGVAWDHLVCTTDWSMAMRSADAVCFGTLAQRSRESRAAIHAALDATSPDCLIVCDVNLRQQWYDRDVIDASLQRANLVKLNDEEQIVLSSLLGIEGATAEQFAEHLRERYHVDTVCVTRGRAGCWISSLTGAYDIAGVEVDVADTVGAGDAFTAGLVTALLQDWPIESAARFANRVGALVASHTGGMPDISEEAAELFAEFSPASH